MSGKYRTVCKDGSSDTFTVNCLPETQCRRLPVTLIFIFPKHHRSLVVNFLTCDADNLPLLSMHGGYSFHFPLVLLEFPLTCR